MPVQRVSRWMVALRTAMALSTVFAAAACGPAAGNATPDFVEVESTIDVGSITIRDATQAAVVPDEVTLAEAEALLPFAVSLPTAVPAGFTQVELVEVVAPAAYQDGDYASLIVTWENADGAAVTLHQSTLSADAPAVGASGTSEDLLVKGQPGTLLQTQGLGPDRLILNWRSGYLDYRLTAEGGALTRDQLLDMAESIP